jgi:hypothetical protein
MKTSELTGAALYWAVAQAIGKPCHLYRINHRDRQPAIYVLRGEHGLTPAYSTNWAQGGPIIEREVPMLMRTNGGDWIAQGSYDTANDKEAQRYYGPTPLIAAMRCYVASKLGDDVDVPEELL